MAYEDLREFIDHLSARGELVRVKTRVDWEHELAAISKRTLDLRGPALLFENVKDYATPVFTGAFGTLDRTAMALGLEPGTPQREVVKAFKDRIGTSIAARKVPWGPSKENIHTGEDVDVLEFPSPLWHELDGGRYIGTLACVVTRDPETGWQNAGVYRIVIHDKNTLGVLIAAVQHIGIIYQKYEAMNKPMPIAIAIGVDPACAIASSTRVPDGVDEWAVAGGLRGKPLDVVGGETVDLDVPATAEIVLEGEVPPAARLHEGPFGEHTGYYGGGIVPRPLVRVNCITHRNHPILQGLYLGRPVTEQHHITSVMCCAMTLKLLEDAGFPGIKGVSHPMGGDPNLSVVISMSKSYQSQPLDAAMLILDSREGIAIKNIVIVDDDVDIDNLEDVWFAMNTRMQAGDGVSIIRGRRGSILDPSVPPGKHGISDRLVIDATWSLGPDFPPLPEWNGLRHAPLASPPKHMMDFVERRWPEYGIDCGLEGVDKK